MKMHEAAKRDRAEENAPHPVVLQMREAAKAAKSQTVGIHDWQGTQHIDHLGNAWELFERAPTKHSFINGHFMKFTHTGELVDVEESAATWKDHESPYIRDVNGRIWVLVRRGEHAPVPMHREKLREHMKKALSA